MKKVIFVILGFVLLSLSCRDELKTEGSHENLENWIPAFTRFSEQILNDEACRIHNCYNVADLPDKTLLLPWEHVYPKCYGGIYGDLKNKSNFFVLLTDTSNVCRDNFFKLCQVSNLDKITFKLCKFSYNELLNMLFILSKVDKKKWGIIDIGINDSENRVEILFQGNRDEIKRERFKAEVIDSPMIEYFYQDEYDEYVKKKYLTPHVTSKESKQVSNSRSADRGFCTGALFLSESGNIGRIGFCAYRTTSSGGEQGFITALHNFGSSTNSVPNKFVKKHTKRHRIARFGVLFPL